MSGAQPGVRDAAVKVLRVLRREASSQVWEAALREALVGAGAAVALEALAVEEGKAPVDLIHWLVPPEVACN